MTRVDAIAATQNPEWLNPLFATLHARSKDTPGKTWWHAEAMHPAIFRALRLSSTEEGAIFAAVPFRLHRPTKRILVAFPCPRIFAPNDDDDWLGIESVLSWDPVTDSAEIMGEPGPALAGIVPHDAETLEVHTSPFAFLRTLAEARAQWIVRRHMVGGDWRRKPAEPDLTPGLLLIGSVDKVRWPIRIMPENITCHGLDPKALNRAMLRQARIPRAVSAPQPLRRAA